MMLDARSASCAILAVTSHGTRNCDISIDLIHKSQNAPVPYLTMLHSEHFCSEWSIVGYGTGAFWDLWNWSIGLASRARKLVRLYFKALTSACLNAITMILPQLNIFTINLWTLLKVLMFILIWMTHWISQKWCQWLVWRVGTVLHRCLCYTQDYFDGWAQDCSNSIASALELLLSCAQPSTLWQALVT